MSRIVWLPGCRVGTDSLQCLPFKKEVVPPEITVQGLKPRRPEKKRMTTSRLILYIVSRLSMVELL